MPGKRVTDEEREIMREMRIKGETYVAIERVTRRSIPTIRSMTLCVVPEVHRVKKEQPRRVKSRPRQAKGALARHIAINLTEAEYQKLRQAAETEGCSVSFLVWRQLFMTNAL
jgi:hypothetical protein